MTGEFGKFLGKARGGFLRNIRISTRLIIYYTLTVLLILSAVFLTVMEIANNAEQRELDDHLHTAQLLSTSMDTRLREYFSWLVAHLGKNRSAEFGARTSLAEMMEDIHDTGLFPGGIYIVDREGRVTQSVAPQSELMEKIESYSALKEVLSSDEPQIVQLICQAGTENRWTAFTVPIITSEGAVSGVILGLSDLQYTNSIIQETWQTAQSGGGYVDVIDLQGRVIISSDPGHNCRQNDHQQDLLPYLVSRKSTIGYFPVETPGAKEEMDAVALVPLEIVNWSVAVELPKGELREPISDVLPWMLMEAVFMIVITSGAFYLIYRTIIYPLNDLLAAEWRLSQGDLDTPLGWGGNDEISRLSSGFEDMRLKLAHWGRDLEIKVAERTQRLEVINEIQQVISSSLTLDDVYGTLVTEAGKLISFDRMGISLMDEEGTGCDVKALWTRNDPVLLKGTHWQLDNTPFGQVLMRGEPWLEGEIGEKGTWPVNSLLISEGIHSRLLIPLKNKGINLGVLTFGSYQAQAFSDADINVLLPIANQLAIAIENSNLFLSVKKRLAELETLTNISSSMRTAKDTDQILAVAFEAIAGILETKTGGILLFDDDQDHLVVSFARGQMSGMLGMRYPLEGSLHKECLETGKLKVDTALPKSPGMDVPLSGQEKSIQIPLLASDNMAVGIILIYCSPDKEINKSEYRLLTAIADMVANAIYRIQLFTQLQTHLQELDSLYKVSRSITTTLRVDTLIDLVVIAAQESMLVEGSWIHIWDEKQGCLILRSVTGFPSDLVGIMRYKSGEGLTGWVFQHNEIVNVPDLTADDRWSREPEFEGYLPSGLAKNALIVPLRVGERMLGALGVVNKIHASIFNQRDENFLLSLARQVEVSIEKAQLYENIRELSVGTIRSLAAAIDARDPYTHGHSQGVTYLAVELGKHIGLIPAELEYLEFAALLHDVGKIAIPDQILRKKEKLTSAEWDSIRLHPYYGIQIIHPVAALARIEPWIYHHHEKWDGSGYPDGLQGENIPLEARILTIADTYNAMTTNRPYRQALSKKEALTEIRNCAGTQFDPDLAEKFIALIVGKNDSSDVSEVLS